tara:strand:+ start:69 stop:464 length:396 start_codon:yes stop_codon:yes gene_type:complete
MDDIKQKWQVWSMGNKIIFSSACVAAVSMLLTWVDIGFASQNGLSQGTFLLLGFYIYPVMRLLKNEDMNKLWGRVCSIGSVITAIIYISSKTIEVFGSTVNAASTGAYLFLFASIALIVGIEKYTTINSNE